MSNNDFEVMPIGTIEEVREMRRLSKELIELEYKHGIDTPQPLRIKILEIARFYNNHSEKYPVS